MALTLHHADRVEPLLDRVADLLLTPLPDPFQADVVVVPTAGVRDAVTAHLGTRLGTSTRGGDGVAANVDLLYIGRFVNRALAIRSVGDNLEPDPWHISRLTWTVLDELATGSVSVPTVDITWSFARRVADLFDRYATQRPDMVEGWAKGHRVDAVFDANATAAPLPAEHLWQFELWQKVRERIGTPSLPELLPELLDRLGAGAVQPDLPPRVALVGFGSLAPSQWRVLQALGHRIDVHVMLRTPSREVWSAGGVELAGRLVAARGAGAPDVVGARRHPLLVSWGRRALEGHAFIGGTPGVTVVDDNTPSELPTNLLQAIQTDIRLDRSPVRWPGYGIGDRSLQVHACHGDIRQLEVLRDALGHLFVDDPTLRPRDVVVLCPQLDRFAPLVEAVFGRGDMSIPVKVGDRSLSVEDPIASAFQAVLGLAQSRVSLSEVIAVIQLAPVRRRFGWSVADVETITAWALELGTRWGLSPEHRLGWGLPTDVTAGTWQLLVQQLLAGVMQSAPSPRLGFGGIPPVDGLDAQDAAVVGSFAEFLGRVGRLHEALAGSAHPIATWVDFLHEALDDFCGRDPAEPWSIEAVHAALDDLRDAATPLASGTVAEPSSQPLDAADVRAMLDEVVRDRAGRLSLRSGAVTVTSLQPMHGVPARVVCFLGLDDGSLASGSFDGDDILGITPCIGERNPRHDSRQMLLDSLLAASDAVIVTCNGSDITTNAKKPFIVPLAELLDVVAVTIGATSADDLPIVARHPRHGFADRALVVDEQRPLLQGLGRPFTFDRSMLKAAKDRERRVVVPDTGTLIGRWALEPSPMSSVHAVGVGHLVSAADSPAKQMLTERLHVASMPDTDSLVDDLSLSIHRLAEAALGRQLLGMLRDRHPQGLGSDDKKYDCTRDPHWLAVVDEWAQLAAFDGSLPPGMIGTVVLRDVAHAVMNLWWAAWQRRVPLAPPGVVSVGWSGKVESVDRTAVPVEVVGDVSGIHRRSDENVIVDLRFARDKPRYRLAVAIQLAACQLSYPDESWSAEVIARKAAKGVVVHRLTIDGHRGAESLLALATQLSLWSRCDAVPFFDEASLLAHQGSRTADVVKQLDSEIRRDATALLWRGWSGEDLLAVPVLETDPTWLDRRASSRLRATADWVWGTYSTAVVADEPTVATKRQTKVTT